MIEYICSKCARKPHLKVVPRYCVVCGNAMTRVINGKDALEHRITALRSQVDWRQEEIDRLQEEIVKTLNELGELS